MLTWRHVAFASGDLFKLSDCVETIHWELNNGQPQVWTKSDLVGAPPRPMQALGHGRMAGPKPRASGFLAVLIEAYNILSTAVSSEHCIYAYLSWQTTLLLTAYGPYRPNSMRNQTS